MLKTSRQIDTLIFSLDDDIVFTDTFVKKGWNQIKREKNAYYVFSLDNLNKPYTFLHLDEMPVLLTVLFAKQIHAEGDFELVDEAPIHSHKKINLKKMG